MLHDNPGHYLHLFLLSTRTVYFTLLSLDILLSFSTETFLRPLKRRDCSDSWPIIPKQQAELGFENSVSSNELLYVRHFFLM
jgi:hypothetical protein